MLLLCGVNGLNGDFWDGKDLGIGFFLRDLSAIAALRSLRCSFLLCVHAFSTHG